MDGVIVCPELKDLLTMECHYCHEIGHSTGYCYKLKTRDFGCRHCDTFKHKQKNCKLYREWRDERRIRRNEERIERQERIEQIARQQDLEDMRYNRAMWFYRDNPTQQHRIHDEYTDLLFNRH
jgi:hypothetical protein